MYSHKFYESIGHAFYAVAHADKAVNKEEFKSIMKIVREEWAPLEDETDEFGEDVAFQIVSVFDWLADNDVKEKEALKRFKDYVAEHHNVFNVSIKNKIIKTCKKIAQSSHGVNKKENHIIQEIVSILK